MTRRPDWIGFDTARAPLPGRRSYRPPRPCPCGCGTLGLCGEHRARLADIRADLAGDIKVLGQYAKRADQRKRKYPPTCCAPGCFEPRLRTERYCAACRDAGWAEDALT